jgi:CRISPR-associated exonuclease Cas4
MDNKSSYDDDDLVLISAIEHFAYCPRQYALIHVEQVFEENVFTLQGSAQHARADETTTTYEEGVRVERALPLWSERYGLLGKADVVEFADDGRVTPVEYKHGAKRKRQHDDLQLCAQALCLEEMLGVAISDGAVFYHGSQRRREVPLTPTLRAATAEAIAAIRALARAGTTPPPVNDARCEQCSLNAVCQPELLALAGAVASDPLYQLPPEEA